jgi:hypothetical protein
VTARTAPFGEGCRKILEEVGFDGNSLRFQSKVVEWKIPSARYLFEAERDAGVRTAGPLARQSAARLKAISQPIEKGVRRSMRAGEFSVPMAANLVTISKL